MHRVLSTIAADAVRKLYGAEGDGVVWAILDSGIDASHPHFKKHSNLESSPFHRDFSSDDQVNKALEDEHGTGTAIAGIVAGELEGKFKAVVRHPGPEGDINLEQIVLTNITGVAPKTKLVSLKVLDGVGHGLVTNVLAAIAHIQEINGYGRRLLIHGATLGVGFEYDQKLFACGLSPVCLEVDRLVRSGVVVVVAAGNTGSGISKTDSGVRTTVLEGSINDPGNTELAITVGSTHREMPQKYGVSYFSSKGPTADGRKKPDIVAPGQDVVCCSTGRIKAEQGKKHSGALYAEFSGTGMAAAVVSGAVAALLSSRRELIGQPDVIKRLLMETTIDLQRSEFYQGRGLINLMKAFGGPGGEPMQPAHTGSSSHVVPREPTVVRPSTSAIRESEELESSAVAPVRLMCSYSHKDEQLWEELKEHLSPLQRQGLLKVWYDRAIEPGSEWEDQIFKELAEAEIIILLVSASFTASDFCFRHELTAAIERHKTGQCRVIPVIARAVDWKKLSFGRLQALPKDGKPVTSYTRQDEAWLQVAEGIRLIIEKFDRDRKPSGNQ